jgi:uncharacterized protein (TIGR02246 family)
MVLRLVMGRGQVRNRLGIVTTEHEEADIRSVMGRVVDSWNRHDMHSFAALFAHDAHFVDVFGNWFRSRAAIESVLSQRHATVFKDSRFTEKEVVIRMPRRDLAVVHAVLELSGATDPQGNPFPPGLGVMTFLMDKANGDWRIIAFQNTTVAPPPATAAPPR